MQSVLAKSKNDLDQLTQTKPTTCTAIQFHRRRVLSPRTSKCCCDASASPWRVSCCHWSPYVCIYMYCFRYCICYIYIICLHYIWQCINYIYRTITYRYSEYLRLYFVSFLHRISYITGISYVFWHIACNIYMYFMISYIYIYIDNV